MRPDLHQRAADRDAGAEDFPRDRAGGDARGGLARRSAAAAAIVADAVFLPVGIVSVAGAEAVGDVAVVARALVDIVDHQVDRRPGGRALEGPGEDLDLIGLLALRRIARLAGPAAVEPLLDVAFGQRDLWRHAVDDDADRRPVAFAPGGKAEEGTECVAGHG